MTPKSLLRHELSVSALRRSHARQLRERDRRDRTTCRRSRCAASCSAAARCTSICSKARRKDDAARRRARAHRAALSVPDGGVRGGDRAATPNAREIVWCQEEPQNQGAWYQIRHRLQEALSGAPRAALRRPCAGRRAGDRHPPSCTKREQHGAGRRGAARHRHRRQRGRETARLTATASQEELMTHRNPSSAAARIRRRRDAGRLAQEARRCGERATRTSSISRPTRSCSKCRRPRHGVLEGDSKSQNGATVTSGQVLAILEEGAGAAASAAAASLRPRRRAPRRAPSSHAGRCAGGCCRRSGAASSADAANAAASATMPSEAEPLGAAAGRGEPPRSGQHSGVGPRRAHHQGGRRRRICRQRTPTPAKPAGARAARAAAFAQAHARRARRAARADDSPARSASPSAWSQAQSTQALLTSFNEVDLTAVQDLRARYKERFEKEHGVKLGFMSFFVKAAIEALKSFPSSTPRSTATTSSITSTTTSASRSRPIAA